MSKRRPLWEKGLYVSDLPSAAWIDAVDGLLKENAERQAIILDRDRYRRIAEGYASQILALEQENKALRERT